MAANSTTVTANGTVSPKVYWPMVVGTMLVFVTSFLAGVTPEMLGALGPFAVPMAVALTAVAQTITGYLKHDELRTIGVDATAAVLPAPPTVLPPVVDETSTEATVSDAPDTAGDLQAEVEALNCNTRA